MIAQYGLLEEEQESLGCEFLAVHLKERMQMLYLNF